MTETAAVVTGASAGIGRRIARDLAVDGRRVYAISRRDDLLAELVEEAGADAGEVVPIACDLALMTDQLQAIDVLLASPLPIDVIVNNAGGSVRVPPDDPEPSWSRTMEVQFHAVRRFTDALAPQMIARQFGRIVNIGAPLEPPPLMNASTVTKGALTIWAKIRSTELAPHGVTVNTIAPGRITSEQVLERLHPTQEERDQFAREKIPAGYIGDPADMSALVRFLISPEARYITGELIHVDGGLRQSAW